MHTRSEEHATNTGQTANVSGVSVKIIRYYESIGLVASADRSEGNHRMYHENDIHTLRFIGRARALDFSMVQTRGLLGLQQNKRRTNAAVKAIALQRTQELDARIAALSGMRDTPRHLAQHCDGNDRPDCPILEIIGSAAPRQLPAPQATRH